MTVDVRTLDAELDIVSAASALCESRFRRFPVLQDGLLVGQLSRVDVLRVLAQQWA